MAAPGVDILSTLPADGRVHWDPSGYGLLGGTSMATPHVAGVAGLLWSKGGSALDTPAEIRAKIESTADQISGTGKYWTKGRIDACRALGLAASTC